MLEFRRVNGHIEVYLNGEFQFSADNMRGRHMKNYENTKYVRFVKPRTCTTVCITYEDGVLTLNGNTTRASGQIYDMLMVGRLANGFTHEMCENLRDLWRRWHLNNLRAGTPNQEAYLRRLKKMKIPNDRHDYQMAYNEACAELERVHLLYDGGYKYGTQWLSEDVPDYVLEYLFNLPGTGNTYADILRSGIDEEIFNKLVGFC